MALRDAGARPRRGKASSTWAAARLWSSPVFARTSSTRAAYELPPGRSGGRTRDCPLGLSLRSCASPAPGLLSRRVYAPVKDPVGSRSLEPDRIASVRDRRPASFIIGRCRGRDIYNALTSDATGRRIELLTRTGAWSLDLAHIAGSPTRTVRHTCRRRRPCCRAYTSTPNPYAASRNLSANAAQGFAPGKPLHLDSFDSYSTTAPGRGVERFRCSSSWATKRSGPRSSRSLRSSARGGGSFRTYSDPGTDSGRRRTVPGAAHPFTDA